MRIVKRTFIWAAITILTVGCSGVLKSGQGSAADSVVTFTILHLNDIYEIAPVESGQRGGLARVATILHGLENENPNTVAILAGDLLSPSAIGATKIHGKPIAGAHMVEVLNTLGLDYVTLGNHEFDVGEAVLEQRITDSQFKWLTDNAFDAQGKRFSGTMEHDVVTFRNRHGAAVRVGLIGVCLDAAKKKWVSYTSPLEAAQRQVTKLKDDADLIVAMTHLKMSQDKELAATVPELEILMGGHEHEHANAVSGNDHTPIYKADANAKTVYVHRFRYDTHEQTLLGVDSKLVVVDDSIPEDPEVARLVKGWIDRVYAALRAKSFEPEEVIGIAKETLDGQESSVRNHPTNLTKLIAASFADAAPKADAVIYGSGSIRIDDRIMPGNVPAFDVLRIFPFGGYLILAEMTGDLPQDTLEQGDKKVGSGGYLLYGAVSRDATGAWLVKGQPLIREKIYKVLFDDFVFMGVKKRVTSLNLSTQRGMLKQIRQTAPMQDLFIARLKHDMNTKGGSP
ncbi:MAG: bifunctional metallophosphatase/5'-nucleotidase [Nitrospirales bacterium]|nr:bifunctional metallophosphatase/5'-nucleotidase [Nitrospirales bacterium]